MAHWRAPNLPPGIEVRINVEFMRDKGGAVHDQLSNTNQPMAGAQPDMLRQCHKSRGGQIHLPTAVMRGSLRFEREALRLNGSLPG